MTPRHIVVVGTGAAGVAVLESLRRGGFDGQVTMIGDEKSIPYDRPPLSKQFFTGEWDLDRLNLRSSEALDALAARWVTGHRATGLDPQERCVCLDDGSAIDYDELVVATGVRPRRLPESSGVESVHVLRTVEDATRLRACVGQGSDLLVAGGGFLGAEVAAAANMLGSRVTLVSTTNPPLADALGTEVAGLLAEQHEKNGVRMMQGRVRSVTSAPDGRATGVLLENGTQVDASNILVSVGSHPNVEWLEGSGIPSQEFIACDEDGRVVPGVWAVGDVAAWWDPASQCHLRLEHRTKATEQGMNVARTIMGQPSVTGSVPYVWSDQYDLKVQMYGLARGADSFTVVDGSIADGKFTGLYGKEGSVCAAVGVNMVRPLRSLRQHVVTRTSWADLEGLLPAVAAP